MGVARGGVACAAGGYSVAVRRGLCWRWALPLGVGCVGIVALPVGVARGNGGIDAYDPSGYRPRNAPVARISSFYQ